MKKIVKLGKAIIRDEKGYGTVELLVLVAALGIVATGLMISFNKSLVELDVDGNPTATSAAGKIKGNIDSALDKWIVE